MNKNNVAIKLAGVSKIYQLHHEKPTLIDNLLGKNNREKFVALNNINLEIIKGSRVGIVGPNGSGKTTLLKIISGIATPNRGKVETWGKIVSLIDLSAGFHPELTGVENVYQNAMLLGMNREETSSKMDLITNFADIKKFMDAPMYTYSDGMKMRLGFSVAIAAEPDILILDEGVVVGDNNFYKKSKEKINEIIKSGKTILIASHVFSYIRENCQKIVWLYNGNLIKYGDLGVLDEYEKT
jgi:ABC-type polysaccharide/polyol phosphate transport system ATPase subunit